MSVAIAGFLDHPRADPKGKVYRGRLVLPDVQWTGTGEDAVVTATVTVEQLTDAIESNLVWTDQAVQRGILPSSDASTPTELPVAAGYPDARYIFDPDNADRIVEKLLYGERLFLNPLVWNMRPGTFEAYWDESEGDIYVYGGRIYLPDSHHRHQALLKAVRAYRENPAGYPKFSLDRQFKIEIYFLSREDEGNYFFDKNQRPKPTALSKAYDLTTQDDLSTLAKKVLERLPALDAGVNRATDRVSKKAPHFMTLSTLREMMRIYAGAEEVEEAELDGLAAVAADFFEMLASVRPELRVETSHAAREDTLASSGVMLMAYAGLMRDYAEDLVKLGSTRARRVWGERLLKLSPTNTFTADGWSGDFMSKRNPLWITAGVTKPAPATGRLTIVNTGGSRSQATREVRKFLS